MSSFGGLRVINFPSDAGRLFAAGFQSAQARQQREADRELAQKQLEAELKAEEQARQEDQAAAQAAAIIGQSMLYDAGMGGNAPGDRAVLDDQVRNLLPNLVTQSGTQGLRLLGPMQAMQQARQQQEASIAERTALDAQRSELQRQIDARRSLIESGRVSATEPAGREILREIETIQGDMRALETQGRRMTPSEMSSLRNVFARENPRESVEGMTGSELRLRLSQALRIRDEAKYGETDVPKEVIDRINDFIAEAAPRVFAMEEAGQIPSRGGDRSQTSTDEDDASTQAALPPAVMNRAYQAAMQLVAQDKAVQRQFLTLQTVEERAEFINELAARIASGQNGG